MKSLHRRAVPILAIAAVLGFPVEAISQSRAAVDSALGANSTPLQVFNNAGVVIGRYATSRFMYSKVKGAGLATITLMECSKTTIRMCFTAGNLFYESSDCSGSPYLFKNFSTLGALPSAVRRMADGTNFLYVAASDDGIANFVANSFISTGTDTGSSICTPRPITLEAAFPSLPAIDVTVTFEEPFLVK